MGQGSQGGVIEPGDSEVLCPGDLGQTQEVGDRPRDVPALVQALHQRLRQRVALLGVCAAPDLIEQPAHARLRVFMQRVDDAPHLPAKRAQAFGLSADFIRAHVHDGLGHPA